MEGLSGRGSAGSEISSQLSGFGFRERETVRGLGFPHLADEPETFSGNRSDQALLLAAVADCLANRIDMTGQVENAETIRPAQTAFSRASLLTTRSRFCTKYARRSKTCRPAEIAFAPRVSSRRSRSSRQSPNRSCISALHNLYAGVGHAVETTRPILTAWAGC